MNLASMKLVSMPGADAPRYRRTKPKTPRTTNLARTRPAYEKLLIGPVMVFGEMITGGHYLEVLRIGKQMVVGHEAAPSYYALHAQNIQASGGVVGAFYRGFLPWGLLQCSKGLPVLFVQHESVYQLQHRLDWSKDRAEKLSGFLGGAAQGLFVNPMQKVKVTVVASEQMNALGPMRAFQTVVSRHGFSSLYDGVVPMMLRRSLDWGIRFAVSSHVKQYVVDHKQQQGQSSQLNFFELVGCGMIGGLVGTVTHPIDNIITNCQKPLLDGKRRDVVAVVQRMYRESGHRAFTRAWGIKVVDNAYHMAWMYGVGTLLYEWMSQQLREPQH